MSFLLQPRNAALLALLAAGAAAGGSAAWGLLAPQVGSGAAAMGLGAGAVLLWRAGRAAAGADDEELSNRRDEHRVLAWSPLPVTVEFNGEKHRTLVQNVSMSGMALKWGEPRIRSGTRAVLHIPGYLILPAMVIAEGRGMLRLTYTDEVPDRDRRRLRDDCIAGAWSRQAGTDAQPQASPVPVGTRGG